MLSVCVPAMLMVADLIQNGSTFPDELDAAEYHSSDSLYLCSACAYT